MSLRIHVVWVQEQFEAASLAATCTLNVLPCLFTMLLCMCVGNSVGDCLIQDLNTLSLRFSGETEVLEKLDSIRVKASKLSPMMETIKLV